jgi:hypothetical protein
MCLSCLTNQLDYINECSNHVETFMMENPCDCGNCFINFVKKTYQDLKFICLLKIKRNKQSCPNGIQYLKHREIIKIEEIKQQLTNIMEQLFDEKETLIENDYLTKSNHIKDLNDIIEELELAEHR